MATLADKARFYERVFHGGAKTPLRGFVNFLIGGDEVAPPENPYKIDPTTEPWKSWSVFDTKKKNLCMSLVNDYRFKPTDRFIAKCKTKRMPVFQNESVFVKNFVDELTNTGFERLEEGIIVYSYLDQGSRKAVPVQVYFGADSPDKVEEEARQRFLNKFSDLKNHRFHTREVKDIQWKQGSHVAIVVVSPPLAEGKTEDDSSDVYDPGQQYALADYSDVDDSSPLSETEPLYDGDGDEGDGVRDPLIQPTDTEYGNDDSSSGYGVYAPPNHDRYKSATPDNRQVQNKTPLTESHANPSAELRPKPPSPPGRKQLSQRSFGAATIAIPSSGNRRARTVDVPAL